MKPNVYAVSGGFESNPALVFFCFFCINPMPSAWMGEIHAEYWKAHSMDMETTPQLRKSHKTSPGTSAQRLVTSELIPETGLLPCPRPCTRHGHSIHRRGTPPPPPLVSRSQPRRGRVRWCPARVARAWRQRWHPWPRRRAQRPRLRHEDTRATRTFKRTKASPAKTGRSDLSA